MFSFPSSKLKLKVKTKDSMLFKYLSEIYLSRDDLHYQYKCLKLKFSKRNSIVTFMTTDVYGGRA